MTYVMTVSTFLNIRRHFSNVHDVKVNNLNKSSKILFYLDKNLACVGHDSLKFV